MRKNKILGLLFVRNVDLFILIRGSQRRKDQSTTLNSTMILDLEPHSFVLHTAFTL